jgi:hypothetical protein
VARLDLGPPGSIVVRVSRQGLSVEIDGRPMRGYDSVAAVAWGEAARAGEPTPSWALGKEHLIFLRTQAPWFDAAKAGGPTFLPGRRPNS